jgi:hypothetical protein
MIRTMNRTATAITTEQELKLRVFTDHIQKLDSEQLRNLLITSVKNGMIKDNIIKDFILVGDSYPRFFPSFCKQ